MEINVTFKRSNLAEGQKLVRFGPRPADHAKTHCPACGLEITPGGYSTLVVLGPGADPEEGKKAERGGWFNAVAVEVHWACATGRAE